jgi:hypothetical protein
VTTGLTAGDAEIMGLTASARNIPGISIRIEHRGQRHRRPAFFAGLFKH